MTANSAPGRERRHVYDLVVIGGGVNGVLIARDAAGRGLSVLLCEQDDLASATSSASSKLIHGGLRYLEQGQFRLVRESLKEREVLRHNGHHLIQPMRFVLPVGPNSRPEWMLKLGLWLYDRIGGRQSVPRAERIDLTADARGRILKPAYTAGFAYSDCWVDDSRYVVLNAVDAARRGAVIRTRTCCTAARREGPRWWVTAERANGEEEEFRCRVLVNAAGPWVASVLTEVVGSNTAAAMRLVRGSHIVVPKLYDGNHAYILQAADRRVVFVLPFEQSYSLIGTTEVALDAPLAARGQPHIDPSETQYRCDTVAAYFESAVGPADVVWTFSGIRPLYDDGSGNPSRITRDYVLEVDAPKGEAPIVSVFGGKITTARRLAEAVLARLGGHLLNMRENWTEEALLPGGEMDDFTEFAEELVEDFPGFEAQWLRALARRHGTHARAVIGMARKPSDLGWHFGNGLYAAEFDWMMAEEWAMEPDDILWRRTKCGLGMDPQGKASLTDYMSRRRSG
jgi:glycerol-3-phosphate dehydrogenase